MKVFNKIEDFVGQNKSGIAIGLGLAFGLIGAFLTAKAAIKSKELIDDKKWDENIPEYENLPVKETVKVCWKEWIAPVVSYGISFACILYGKNVDSKKIAAASIAYECLDAFNKEYAQKVKEQIGEEKDQEIRKEIRQERRISDNCITGSEDYFLYDGDSYFLDSYVNKVFVSDTIKIQDAINEFNNKMVCHMDASLNEFYNLIYERTPCALNRNLCCSIADNLGFSLDDGLMDNKKENIKYDTRDVTINGRTIPVYCFSLFRNGNEALPKLIV